MRLPPLIVLLAFLALTLTACFGGGSGDGNDGGDDLADPELVPTATPNENPQVFRIGPNGVSAPDAEVTATPAGGGQSDSSYTVQPGDTCGGIASQFGISAAELIAANPLVNDGCTNLDVGQVLDIPGGTSGGSSSNPTPSSGGASGVYVIEPGDTCGGIASAHGVALADFLAANGLTEDDCTSLVVGDIVTIP